MSVALCPDLALRVGCGRHALRMPCSGNVGAGRIVGAGHVEDDLGRLGVFLFGDGGEGAEELVGDVGEYGGAAGGDFVLGEEEEKAGEKVVDLGGGGEVVEVSGEGGGDFGGLGLILWQPIVCWAEMGVRGGGGETASTSIGVEIRAASRVVDGAGLRGWLGHLDFPFGLEFGKNIGQRRSF
jgi:hypothetical protein